LERYQRQLHLRGGGWTQRLAAFIDTAAGGGTALLIAGLVIAVALLLTGSRGGIASAFVGLLVLAGLVWRAEAADRTASILFLVIGVAGLAAIVFTFGDLIAGHIEATGFSDARRLAVYEITLRSILDKPLLGFGYGTFADVFPLYRDRSISVSGVWGQAHDSYLELAQGLGVVFAGMLIGAMSLIALRCAKGATPRRRNGTASRVAAAAATLVGAHAVVDFSLQIQAVALTFVAMLGAGLAQSASSRIDLQD
jgi:O-antigen ligase